MQERGWIDNSTLRSPAGELMLETLRPRKKLKTVLSLLEKKGTPASEEIVCALMGGVTPPSASPPSDSSR
jgi:hypothetical protein